MIPQELFKMVRTNASREQIVIFFYSFLVFNKLYIILNFLLVCRLCFSECFFFIHVFHDIFKFIISSPSRSLLSFSSFIYSSNQFGICFSFCFFFAAGSGVASSFLLEDEDEDWLSLSG